MKYRINYLSIYREKESVTSTHEIEVKNNKEARHKARKFVRGMNNAAKNKLERFKLIGITRVEQEEVITPVPL